MGPLGWQETVFLFVLALLIFGPKKLPELGKTIGKAMTEFRRASSELKATFDREMHSIERENESLKEVTKQYTSDINNYDSYHDYSYDSGAYDSPQSTAADTSQVGASAAQGAESKETATEQAKKEQPALTPAPDPHAVAANGQPAEDAPASKA